MNLKVYDYLNLTKNKINQKYLCDGHNGLNISPKVSWDISNQNIKSYVLILEDTYKIGSKDKSFIHWYLPFISNQTNQINETTNQTNQNSIFYLDEINKLIKEKKINYFTGQNSLGNFNYFGPCAPKGTGTHMYTFWLFGLNNYLYLTKENTNIKSISDFKNKLGPIKILSIDTQRYFYGFEN